MSARLFHLVRDVDVTGISGTGVVAEGVEFTDGTVALRWVAGEHHSTVLWPSIDDVHAIHGHDGKTRVQWLPNVAEVRAEILRDRADWIERGTRVTYPRMELVGWLRRHASRIEAGDADGR